MSSTLRPSLSGVREYLSGDLNVRRARSVCSIVTLARFANPGIEPQTRPLRSAIASIVIHTIRVESGSHQTVLSVMLLNSLVNVTDISAPLQ